MTLFDPLLADFFGNAVFMSVFIIIIVSMLVFFIRSSKYVIEGIALIVVFGMLQASFIQPWVLFVVISIIGLDIAKLLLSSFLSS